jgi:hypothetical protein
MATLAAPGLGLAAAPAAGLAATRSGAGPAEDLPDLLATLGVGGVVGLERFAAEAGIKIGTGGDDQPAFDAAERAMAAAARAERSLHVRVPPGHYRLRRLRLPNRGGYYADPKTVILEQIAPADGGAPEAFVALADAYASFYLFWGFTLKGGWRERREGFGAKPGDAGQEADPWLYHPAPPGRPDTEAKPGHTAIQLHGAFSGVDDPHYIRNSPIDSQNPRGRVGELEIEGFGGDGLSLRGAGANVFGPIQIFQVGGRGVVIDSYDNNLSALDIGGTGLEGLVLGPNGSCNRILPFKVWYSGRRRLSGHTAALRLDRCATNQLVGQLQDASGGMVEADGCRGCTVVLGVGWAGEIASMDADIAAVTWRGKVRANSFVINAEIGPWQSQAYPSVKRLLRTGPDAEGQRPRGNTLLLNHEGWPDDRGGWNPAWFDGPLDGNSLIVNGELRQSQAWIPDDSGALRFGRSNEGGKGEAGLAVEAAVTRLADPSEVRIDHVGRDHTTALLTATDGRVALGAPLRLKSYTLATAPSPVAAGAGAAIYLVDETPAPGVAVSDGRAWRRISGVAEAKA